MCEPSPQAQDDINIVLEDSLVFHKAFYLFLNFQELAQFLTAIAQVSPCAGDVEAFVNS